MIGRQAVFTRQSEIERHLVQCAALRQDPQVRAADPKRWVIALEALVREGELHVARHCAPLLADEFPEIAYFETVAELAASVPDLQPGDDGEIDPKRPLEVFTRPGARTAIVVFKGPLPATIEHRWLLRLNTHLIYLRDLTDQQYRRALPGVGEHRDEVATVVRGVIDRLGAQECACLGASAGGYGALAYAPALGARRVLALNPQTSYSIDFLTDGARRKLESALTFVPKGDELDALNLRGLYEQDRPSLNVHIAYSTQVGRDRRQAENFGGLPGVSFEAVDWPEHNIVRPLIKTGRYSALLRWLAGDAAAPTLDIPS